MKIYIYRTIAAAALACVSVPAITAGSPTPTASYNFQYKRVGEQQILPLQVFDDGRETYFQFSERAQVLPAILVESAEGMVVSKYHRSGPYVVIPGVASTYRLQFGSLSGAVQYAGPARQTTAGRANGASGSGAEEHAGLSAPGSQAAAPVVAASSTPAASTAAPTAQPAPVRAFGLVAPLGEMEAAARPEPVKADVQIEFAVGKSVLGPEAMGGLKAAIATGEVAKRVITGRDDASYVEGLARARAIAIRAAAVKFGVHAERITMHEGFFPDGADASRPASDVSIIRVATAKSLDPGAPASVADALTLVARGMYGLVKLKAIDDARAIEIVAGIRRLVGVKDDGPTAQGQKAEAAPAKLPEETWVIGPADETAQRGLRKWAERAGMSLDWQADVDYPIRALIVVKGSARTAFNALRDALASAKKPLTIDVESTRVIVRNKG